MVRVGTSAFTAKGWEETFYPAGLDASDYLAYYAEHFDTVEVDSTFYRTPSLQTVRKWHAQTPAGFRFAVKVPQVITHEKCLLDCEAEFARFVETMDALGEKLTAMLLQFPYFNKKVFPKPEGFLDRLAGFLPRLPKGKRFALEIRNKNWVGEELLGLLREHKVAFALIDHPWMPRPAELFARFDPITADFAYIRLLGDRYGIEEQTRTWDKVIVDRSREVQDWVGICHRLVRRGVEVLVYANNHYAGHAPATVRMILEALGEAQKARAAANTGAGE
jgi:uncharacterized protein YecE (DUF72 family)